MRVRLLTLALLVVVAPGSIDGQSGTAACNAPTLPVAGSRVIHVSTEPQLQSAVSMAQAGDTIVLDDGSYVLTGTLYLNGKDNVTIRGSDGCDRVVLLGRGMDNPDYGNVPFGIWSNSRQTTIAHLTIRDTYDNLLIFNAGAQAPHVYSVRLLNAGSQFIKANPTDAANGVGVDDGVVDYCWLEYTAGPPATDHGAGIGYTNGISAHASDRWIIRRNMFKNFHTPDAAAYLWNPAVLMWHHSSNTLTEQNTFINVDRAVAYGLMTQATGHDHQGGTIQNNFIYMDPGLYSASRTAGSDAQIIVWDSPGTMVYHNTVLTSGNVASAIEFRFSSTTGGEARNNLADARINLRDGATAVQSGNLLTATRDMFVDPAAGDLHLRGTASAAIDKAPALEAVTDDFDGDPRPQGAAYDIGADEFRSAGGETTVDFDHPPPPTAPGRPLRLFGGIKWGTAWCWWPAQPGVDSTNHAGFCSPTATARTFSFSPGPRTLTELTLVSSVSGTVTISNGNGRKLSATLVPGQNVVVPVNWPPSSWVKVSSAAGQRMGITALKYR